MSPILPKKTQTFLTFEQFIELAYEARIIAVDTEGFLGQTIWGVSIAFRTNPNGLLSDYFAFNHKEENLSTGQQEILKKLIQEHPRIVLHNAKHDLKAFEMLGINRTKRFFDTMIMAHMVDENIPNKSLDYLTKYFGVSNKKMPDGMKQIIDSLGWEYVPLPTMREYAAQDTVSTLELFEVLIRLMSDEGFDDNLWHAEEKFTRILKGAEQRGILIDQEFIKAEIAYGEKRLAKIIEELGIDPGGRTNQVELFLNRLNLPVLKRSTKTNDPSFDKTVLKEYVEILEARNDPTARLVVEYRGWVTALGLSYRKYLELVGPDGRLHPNFKNHHVRSSRLSAEAPNTQQIPKTSQKRWNGGMKKAFIPSPGFKLIDCDYSNLELRLAAVYSKDENLMALFSDPDTNPFRKMSEDLGWDYNMTKTFVYATMYGAQAKKISEILGCSKERAEEYREQFFDMYYGLLKLMKNCQTKAKREGFIKYWSGRKRHLPGKTPDDDPRLAFNSLLQGGGAEIVKRAIIRVDEAGLNNDDCRIVLQVHDSIVLEVREELVDQYIPKICQIMEDVSSEDSRLGAIDWIVKSKPWGSE